jgi:hypothetical protein
MNDSDILEFISAFDDFMKHSEEQIDAYHKREEAKKYTEKFYKKKAAKLGVTVDYYISEFV